MNEMQKRVLHMLPWNDNMSDAISVSSLELRLKVLIIEAVASLVEQGAVVERPGNFRSLPRYARSRQWAETQQWLGVQEEEA